MEIKFQLYMKISKSVDVLVEREEKLQVEDEDSTKYNEDNKQAI